MKIKNINTIREFVRLSGKKCVIQTQRQEIPKLPEAFCKTRKELALFCDYPKDYFCHQV